MADSSFTAGFGFSSLGMPGRSSNTSGNVGLAGSALLPTITAELRSEFYPLLSTLANSGSDISAAYIMELFFALIRFDAILRSDERYLFVSTSQQLITKQLQQLQTVHHKVKLLEENLRFVEQLVERCAALEVLCGIHEEEIDDGDDDDAAATTAPDIATGTEEDDEGGEAGNTANVEETTGGNEGETATAATQSQQQQRVAPSRSARSTLRTRNLSSLSNTACSTTSSAHRRRFFSFDEDIDDAINRSGEAQKTALQLQQQQQNPQPQLLHRRRGEEERAASVARSTGGDTNTFTVSSSAGPLRPRHLQRPPPLPLNLMSESAPSATGAGAVTAERPTGTRARIESRQRHGTQVAVGQLIERRVSDRADGAPATTSTGDRNAGVPLSGGDGASGVNTDEVSSSNTNTSVVTPAVFTGVQHALQEHFRQNVKRTLNGTSGAAPTSTADATPTLQPPPAPGRTPRGANASDHSASPDQAAADGGVSSLDKERGTATVAVPPLQPSQPPQNSATLARHPFSVSQLSSLSNTINNSSLNMGHLAVASANHINTFSVDGDGPLAAMPVTGGPYSAVYSPTTLDPVDTARVWDRMFWSFLDGRTATADLVVLLNLLNDGNTALAALQASELNGRRAGSESTAAATTTANTNATTTSTSGITAKHAAKLGGRGMSSSSRMAGLSMDNIARSPPPTAIPTPDCGALPLMEALKRTGSYADILPASTTTDASFAPAAAAAASMPVTVGDNGGLSRARRNRTSEGAGAAEEQETEEQQQQQARLVSCTTDAPASFFGSNAVVSVRGGGGGNGGTAHQLNHNSFSNLDNGSGVVRPSPPLPRTWVSLDDYAKVEEARLHRDFWAHIPAILVTLNEGVMYGSSHCRRSSSSSSTAQQQQAGKGDDDLRRQRKQRASTTTSPSSASATAAVAAAAAAVPSETGSEVADAPTNANSLYDEDGNAWRDAARPGLSTSMAGSRAGCNEDTGKEEENDDDDDEAAAGGEEEEKEETFVPLHPPSTEALQLLPTFSPLLRNYTAAMGKLFQVAPDYARSTQAQHARALAVAAAQQQQRQMVMMMQQQQQLGTPCVNDASATRGVSLENEVAGEGNTAVSTTTTAGSVGPEGGGGGGLGTTALRMPRAATARSSAAELQELNEAAHYHSNSVDRRGLPAGSSGAYRGGSGGGGVASSKTAQPSHLSSATPAATATTCAPCEAADLGLLGEGSCAEVRPVDVVMYALVTAVYVQCAMPVEHQQWARTACNGGGYNGTCTEGRSTAIPQLLGLDVKASPSESGRSPAGSFSPHAGFGWPGGAANASAWQSFAGNGTAAAVDGAEDERALNPSLVNGSPSCAANTGSNTVAGVGGGWWDTSNNNINNNSIGVGSGGGRGYLPANASFGLMSHGLRLGPPPFSNTSGVGRFDNASFATPRQCLQNLSFDVGGSPTEAALSFLRNAHEERANGGVAGADQGAELERKAEGSASYASTLHGVPLSMHFSTQDVLACANEFSWVSLPSVMKAELQNLQAQLGATHAAVQRMEGQVRGELALLLFRVLSMVLDWLMPAVYVADSRIWLFYRKWCCDLYRVLCTDLALLDEFRRLLNQSGVAVIAASPGGDAAAKRSRRRREPSVQTAMSATTTPTSRPLRSDGTLRTPPRPEAQPGTPVLSVSAAVTSTAALRSDAQRSASVSTAEDEGSSAVTSTLPNEARRRVNADEAADEDDGGRGGGGSSRSPASNSIHVGDSSEVNEEPDLFSCILPGSSLVVSVSKATPPMQPGVLHLLEQEEADRRGEAVADMASLRAAQALLSDEGKVVPLPRPFLITKLVAATLRGIDADIAESLLWVVGEGIDAAHTSAEARAKAGPTQQHATTDYADAFTGHPLALSQHLNDEGDDDATLGGRSSSSPPHGAAANNVHSTAQWKSQRPRHSSRTSSGHRLRTPHHGSLSSSLHNVHQKSTAAHRDPSSIAAAAAAGAGNPRFDNDDDDDDDDDSDDVQGMDRRYGSMRWYTSEEGSVRRRSSRLPPAPAQSPVADGPAMGGGGISHASVTSTSMFPVTTPHTPYTDLPMGVSPQLQYPGLSQSPPQTAAATATVMPEGPMLVHHHRFRYPSVSGFADVAQLYLNTLEDAELLLSPHDPIYASLVLSTADLHLHDLHDRETAATLVNSYLADVSEEHIQAPIWDVLPTNLMPMMDSSSSSVGGQAGTTPTESSSAANLTAGRGFSVTRVRQGNAGVRAGLSFAGTPTSAAATAAAASTSAALSASPPAHPPAPQQPYVPMAIASWNDEREKNEFLGTLRVLRQIQVFLTQL